MESFPELARYFPASVLPAIRPYLQNGERLEEIHLRIGRPLSVFVCGTLLFPNETGNPVCPEKAFVINESLMKETLARMTGGSVYAVQDQLKQGFFTLAGGHRVGVTGKAVMRNGEISHLKEISSLNLRIARAVVGCADALLPLITENGQLQNTLLISPPQCGKTTLLRDLARQLASPPFQKKVSVLDERGEIAGVKNGVPQFDVGTSSDILSFCPKAEGMLMLIRAMSPEIIVLDEIGSSEECRLMGQLLNAGVKVLCSAHGYDKTDLTRRGGMGSLISEGVFRRVVLLSRRNGPGTLEVVET